MKNQFLKFRSITNTYVYCISIYHRAKIFVGFVKSLKRKTSASFHSFTTLSTTNLRHYNLLLISPTFFKLLFKKLNFLVTESIENFFLSVIRFFPPNSCMVLRLNFAQSCFIYFGQLCWSCPLYAQGSYGPRVHK